MTDLYIVGAGGFGREALDACLDAGFAVAAFADERRVGTCVRDLPVIPIDAVPSGAAVVVAIADPVARRRLAATLTSGALRNLQTVIHPRATIAPETSIGDGSVVLAHAHVSSSCRLGAQVQVSFNATIGHDARLDDAVTVQPGANVANGTHLEPDVTVGANACVLQGVHVGAAATIGAGAVVTRDLGPRTVVTAAPALARGRPHHAVAVPETS
jgi:sugar O-acyltransferase (sialic acid O-acetyltransferase NeuD family)